MNKMITISLLLASSALGGCEEPASDAAESTRSSTPEAKKAAPAAEVPLDDCGKVKKCCDAFATDKEAQMCRMALDKNECTDFIELVKMIKESKPGDYDALPSECHY